MSGWQRQGFGRRRGMRSWTGRNVTMAGDMFGWIKSRVLPKNMLNRTVMKRSESERMDQTDELNRLKHAAESIQSQLKEINSRIHKIEKEPNPLFAHIDSAVCTGCGRCVPVCTQSAVALTNGTAWIDQNKCTGCGICIPQCPVGAIDLAD